MNNAAPDNQRSLSSKIVTIIGVVLGSGVIVALIGLIPQYFPPAKKYEWVPTRLPAGDCEKYDLHKHSSAGAIPKDDYCDSHSRHTIAVCWDGVEYKNDADTNKPAKD